MPTTSFTALCLLLSLLSPSALASATQGHIAYLVSDQQIPFWDIVWRGVRAEASAQGYRASLFSADNNARRELENTVQAIARKVDGIVLSPTNSSAAATVLKLAQGAGIPVVIADIGTESGTYVSYISSDNHQGSYALGQLLVQALQQRGWQDGQVATIAIPQTRANGKARTAGFLQALAEGGVRGGDLRQQVDFSERETYDFARQMIEQHPGLRAIWLQGSNRYRGALRAIADAGRQGEILLICFDAEPEFVQLIPDGTLVGAAMQQAFLMGETAVQQLHRHLQGQAVEHEIRLPVLAVSAANIEALLPQIQRNVLGLSKP